MHPLLSSIDQFRPPVKLGDDGTSPEARLRMLDAVFLRFDDLVAQTDVLKVETVANVYLVAANGAPDGEAGLGGPGAAWGV